MTLRRNLTPPPHWLIASSTVALVLILCTAILTLWVPGRWSLSLFQTGVLALAAAWALRMIFRPYALGIPPLLIPLGAAVLIGLLQLAARWTVNRWETWNAVLEWFVCLLAFWLASQLFADADILASFRRALLYFAFALSVLATMQYFTSPGKVFWIFQSEYQEGVMGPFVNLDHYAAFIELVLPLALFEGIRDRRRMLPATMMGAAMVASVIAGGSRAGSVLVMAECGAVMLLAPRRKLSTSMPAAFAGSLGLCLLVFGTVVGWTHLWQRFQIPDPYHGRSAILTSTLAMARARPWTGFGLGNFENVYPGYAILRTGDIVTHAHNDWAEWAAEGGLPLFACLLAVALWAAPRAVRSLWGVGVLAVLLHSLVDFPMQKPALALGLFILLGALAAQPRRLPTGGPVEPT